MCWDNAGLASPALPAASQSEAGPESYQCLAPMPGYALPHAPSFSGAPWPLFLSQQHQAHQLSFLKGPFGPSSFGHLYSLKQPLQERSSSLAMPQYAPAPLVGSAQADLREDEPHAKRMAVETSSEAVMVEEEDEEDSEVEDITEGLPDECLTQIMSKLECIEDRMSSALVCRRWLHLISLSKKQPRSTPSPPTDTSTVNNQATTSTAEATQNESGLSRTVEGRSACDARLMSIAIALGDKGGLEKLVVRGRRQLEQDEAESSDHLPLTASGFHAIALSSPNLRSVAIWDCDWLDDEAITVIARQCRRLEKLDVMNCPRLSDKTLVALSRFCPRLSFLSLAACRMVTDRGLQALAKGCKQLSSLSLSSCPYVQGKGIAALCRDCKSLGSLKLAGSMGVTDEGFKMIGEAASGLTRLRLHQLSRLTQDGVKHLGQTEGFRKLRCLSVSSCNGLTSPVLAEVGGGCGELKSLSLAGCANVSDDGIQVLLQSATCLESLILQALPGISNQSARHALEYGKTLRALTISDCPGVKDTATGLVDWTIRCPDLRNLKVSNCSSVGDRCLSSMGRVGGNLSSLDLCGLSQAGDKGVLSFLDSSTAKLCSIDLSGCAQITDKSVTSIAERCGASVRSICLDGCLKVTDKGIRAIAQGCTTLEDLDLSACDVSDKGLKALLNSVGHSLVNLSLAGCVRITDKTVDEILDACPSLSGLNLKNCSGLSRSAVERLRHHALNLFGPTCLFIDP